MGDFRQFIAASLTGALLVACAVEQAKPEVDEIPLSGDYDGKADSWLVPRDGGTLLVGEHVVADFDEGSGWIGYEVALRPGPVDVDLHDANGGSDSELDTLLVVYGPKRADGSYPFYPAAVNDDVVPGENLNSHLLFDVPADGTYRVVASTYLNWWYWPSNVSRGSYQLTSKCPRFDEDPNACGPHLGYTDQP